MLVGGAALEVVGGAGPWGMGGWPIEGRGSVETADVLILMVLIVLVVVGAVGSLLAMTVFDVVATVTMLETVDATSAKNEAGAAVAEMALMLFVEIVVVAVGAGVTFAVCGPNPNFARNRNCFSQYCIHVLSLNP